MEGSTKSSRAPALISERHPLTGDESARSRPRTHARWMQLSTQGFCSCMQGSGLALELQRRHGQWASPLSLDRAPVSLAVFQEWQPTPASAWSLSNSCLLHRDRTQLLKSRVGRALPPKSPATNCYSGHSQSSKPPLPPHKFSRCHPTQILRTLVLLTLFNLFHWTPSGRVGTGKSSWDAWR